MDETKNRKEKRTMKKENENKELFEYHGETYITGNKLVEEYNKLIDDAEETMNTYTLNIMLKDSVLNQTIYSVRGVDKTSDIFLSYDKGNVISRRLKKIVKKYVKKEPGIPAAGKKKDKELREAPKKKMTPTEKIRSLVKQIEEREERNTRLNKRDREAIRKELKKLDKVGKMSLADLIYFPEE